MEAGEVKGGEQDEAVASGERRPSVTQLQGVLKRVSLSPFHSKYKTLVSSTSDSSFSSTAGSQSRQESGFLIDLSDGTGPSGNQITQNGSQNRVNPFRSPAQNGITSKPSNPFFLAPESKANGLNGDPTTVNPFSTQGEGSRGSLVYENNTLPNMKDFTPRSRQSNGWPSASSAETLEPSNTWAVFPPPALSQGRKELQAASTSHASDIFQATPPSWLSEVPQNGPSTQTTDIFQPYKSNKEKVVSVANKSKEPDEPLDETDYLLEYILANQKNDDCQTAPSPTVASDGPSSFFPPPVVTEDLFKTPDIFGRPTSVSSGIFQTPSSNVENRVFQSTPLFQTPASTPADIKAFDPFSNNNNNNAENDDLFKPQKSQLDHRFATPFGTNHDTDTTGTFQKTSPDSRLMFRRRPPKPSPRRSPKNPNQAVDHHSSSKPAQSGTPQTPFIHIQSPPTSPTAVATAAPLAKTSLQNFTSTEEENNNQFYEDVLLIGQEKCVEDWPEDSPQLSSDWKPVGKLKLRRDSLRVAAEFEGAPTSETVGKKPGNKLRKRFSLVSRRGSKDKFGDELKVAQTATLGRESVENNSDSTNGGYGGTLPWGTKFHDGALEDVFSSDQDEHHAAVTSKPVKQKKKRKLVVPQLRYRTAKIKSPAGVSENGLGTSTLSKDGLLEENSKLQSGEKMGNGEEFEPEMKDCRPKEPLKIKPHVPRRPSKSVFEDDLKKMNDSPFVEESKEDRFVKTDAERRRFSTDVQPISPLGLTLNEAEGATGHTPSWDSKLGYQDDPFSPSGVDQLEMQDSRSVQRKPVKLRLPRLPRRGSKSIADEVPQKGADLFKASDGRSSEVNGREEYSEQRKPPILMVPSLSRRDSEGMKDSETLDKGADLFKAEDPEDAETWMEEYSPETKPQARKSHTPSREARTRDQAAFSEDIDPPGATSGDYFLSEAAKAEWMSSQMDVRRTREPGEEERLEGVEEEEEGDTDSLMEWWNTVELWDELPSDEEITLKEDETKSFTEIAGKVHRGLRVFYKVFTEQAEVLYQHVLLLYAISDDLSNFHRRAKIANITGGTTTAVGGVAAITGLALAPVTFGASLIVSAVGLGIATAGGITAASATISDNVHDMNDRKKIETVVQDYETHLVELQSCLRFIAEGIRRLRCHPLLRRNNYYAGDWEVRRALQTVSLVTDPVERAEDIVDTAMAALDSVCKGMDKYFTKDSRELKKGCKKEVTMRVRMLAKQLQDGLMELNSIREQLLDASGNI